MKTIFYVAIALAILFVIMTVYFLIPGIYHPYFSLHDGTSIHLVNMAKFPRVVKSVHHYYAAACLVVALAFGLIAFLLRPKKQSVKFA
ncbi:MAG: hypothetical protein ACYDER_14510 [Ktedonobacteraceae bacterium]